MRTLFRFAAALLLALPFHGAWAAPQILAVLATDSGIPFQCSDGQCRADLSTYCLQRHRPAPDFGTVYAPAAPEVFTLVVTGRGGAERRLPATEHVAFLESRGFMAISATVSESALARLGAVDARIVVGESAVLVPLPQAGDPDPLTAREIAHATGPSRALGRRVVDKSPEAGAARILGAAANALREEGGREAPALDDLVDTGRRAGGRIGLDRARTEFKACREALAGYGTSSLRRCVEFRHDQLMRSLTIDYWDANVGS